MGASVALATLTAVEHSHSVVVTAFEHWSSPRRRR